MVKACDGFTHGIDAVCKWQQRMQPLEEHWHHLDRISTGGTWDLQNDQKYAQCLSDMFECNGKGVDQVDIYKSSEQTGQDEHHGVVALYA